MKTPKILATFTLLALILSGCTFGSKQNGTPQDAMQKITTKEVTYSTADDATKFTGYLAEPADGKKHPGLILIHEWWGLNDNMRENARKFAAQGYTALAIDLYGGKVATTAEEAMKLAGGVTANMDAAFANLRAGTNYLKTLSSVDASALGTVGWCFGGNWAYEMAKNDFGLKTSVMYYGQMHPDDDLQNMKTLILGHFGEKDTSISVDTVKEFQAKLKTLSGEHEIYIYPNDGHGFANPDNPNYDAKSADLAWERTLRFLATHLMPQAANTGNISQGSFTVDANGNWSGTVFVRGYAETKKIPEAFCEKDCKEYDYVSFHMLQTTSVEFKKFLDDNKGNATVGNYEIGLGCQEADHIVYENDSDQYDRKEFQVTPELTTKILATTLEQPIALKLTKLPWSNGRGAPTCYSHFTTIEAVQE